ncbi:MAG TPA: PQQ-binding-like beta-propeller repeat protein [Chloroflexia bacterium]|nr:PQQ-binding-like beta-propeller repeat protein [Chloroflexia bacterium]
MTKSNPAAISLITALVLVLLSGCIDESFPTPTPIPTSIPAKLSTPIAIDRGNVHRTGLYDNAGTPQLTEVFWRYSLEDAAYVTVPIVEDGVLYFSGIKEPNSELHAIDTRTGRLLWKQETVRYSSTPTLSDGVLYYTDQTGLHALDTSTRKEKWNYAVRHGFDMSPAVQHEVVYFGDDRGNMHGIDSQTGEQKWSVKVGNSYTSDPALGDAKLYFAGDIAPLITGPDAHRQNSLYAVDIQTGRQLWTFAPPDSELEYKFFYDVMEANGKVYTINSRGDFYGGDNYVYALDGTSGKQLWRYRPQQSAYNLAHIAANGDLLYVTAESRDNDNNSKAQIFAVDTATGQKRWTFEADGSFTAPSIAGGILYIAHHDKGIATIYALDARTGKEQRSFKFDHMVTSPLVIDGDVLYLVVGNWNARPNYIFAIR